MSRGGGDSGATPEEVRHACTNHYKFSALWSLGSRDMSRPNALALVVICARMSDLPDLWGNTLMIGALQQRELES